MVYVCVCSICHGGYLKSCNNLEQIHEELILAQTVAESSKIGVFNDSPGAVESSIRDLTYCSADGAQALLEANKGTPVPSIIEYVRDGASYRVLLLNGMTTISLNLAGVQCPRINAPRPAAVAPAPKSAGTV